MRFLGQFSTIRVIDRIGLEKRVKAQNLLTTQLAAMPANRRCMIGGPAGPSATFIRRLQLRSLSLDSAFQRSQAANLAEAPAPNRFVQRSKMSQRATAKWGIGMPFMARFQVSFLDLNVDAKRIHAHYRDRL